MRGVPRPSRCEKCGRTDVPASEIWRLRILDPVQYWCEACVEQVYPGDLPAIWRVPGAE